MLTRRTFLKGALPAVGALTAASDAFSKKLQLVAKPPRYLGRKMILIRFGGGVRRQETIIAGKTYAPHFLYELAPRGTLFTNMEIDRFSDLNTGHGEGTLNILTGKYDRYEDIGKEFLGARFEAKVPTLFEYLRKAFSVPEHKTLIINGEDRKDEEFYAFSNHKNYGLPYRSSVLSLYRYKVHLLRRQIMESRIQDEELTKKQEELAELEAFDYRTLGTDRQSPHIESFWENWRTHYGETGLVNPRGDRLLTELALRALNLLRPQMLIINYQDPDYVHWGNPMHYTRGIATIDEGISRLVLAVESDPEYRNNTIFVVVPDCGRDNNRMTSLPYQHHFNSPSAHEIFALFFGPGIAKERVVSRATRQIDIAPTIGHLMGMATPFAEGETLFEIFR